MIMYTKDATPQQYSFGSISYRIPHTAHSIVHQFCQSKKCPVVLHGAAKRLPRGFDIERNLRD